MSQTIKKLLVAHGNPAVLATIAVYLRRRETSWTFRRQTNSRSVKSQTNQLPDWSTRRQHNFLSWVWV